MKAIKLDASGIREIVRIYGLFFIALILFAIILSSLGCKKKSPPDYSGIKGTVTDIDGNIYQTIGIGTQIWMAENLRTTKFNDGSSITLIIKDSLLSYTVPAYCCYNFDSETYKTYGAMYNWAAATSGKLAPKGWHVPSYDELMILINFLGGNEEAGGKMKSTGTIEEGTGIWLTPNKGATNLSGFSGIPGGMGSYNFNQYDSLLYSFDDLGKSGFWWTVTGPNQFGLVCCLWLSYYESDIWPQWMDKSNFQSIRCVKDQEE